MNRAKLGNFLGERSPLRFLVPGYWRGFVRAWRAERLRTQAQARARAAYIDPTRPPRACERCGTTYRGPAVYCSFECALADGGSEHNRHVILETTQARRRQRDTDKQ